MTGPYPGHMPDDAPKYRALADELRADIASGRLPVGGRMPTKATLMKDHDVALGTIDRALNILRDEGLIRSDQGAGTFILRKPGPAEDVPGELAELRGEVAEIRDQARASDAGLRERVGAVETALIDLYGKMGFEYPRKAQAQDREAAGA